MEIQTQYGDGEWKTAPASAVPAVAAQWIRSIASAIGVTESAVTESLERGETIELAGSIEWHDRVRAAK